MRFSERGHAASPELPLRDGVEPNWQEEPPKRPPVGRKNAVSAPRGGKKYDFRALQRAMG